MNQRSNETQHGEQHNAASSLRVVAPRLFPQRQVEQNQAQKGQAQENEAQEMEVLGAAIWLWEHSPMHQDTPLVMLPILLYPIITHQQFILVYENQRPIFFLGWACLNEAAEARYLSNPAVCMPKTDWNSGDRVWFTDFIAPFGHAKLMKRYLQNDWLRHQCARFLYHRSDERGRRVMHFRGKQVGFDVFKQWQQQHPLAASVALCSAHHGIQPQAPINLTAAHTASTSNAGNANTINTINASTISTSANNTSVKTKGAPP